MFVNKVLIAGSTGFLGQALVEKLSKNTTLELTTLNRHSGDFLFKDLNQININFDVIFLLFALLPNSLTTLDDYLEINHELTSQVINKFPNSRFILSSSISVYENSPIKPSSESNVSANISSYAQSKLKAESLLEDKDGIILRLSSLYGPGMKENTFLPIVVNSALKNREVNLVGDDSRKQNYSFIDDVVEDLIQAGFSSKKGIYNCVNDRSYTNKELAMLLVKLLPGVTINYIEDDKKYYSFEISKEKWLNSFGSKSNVDLENGLKRYIEFKKNA